MKFLEALQFAREHPGSFVKPEKRPNDKGAVYFRLGPVQYTRESLETGFFMVWPWTPRDNWEPLVINPNADRELDFMGNWIVIDPKDFFNEGK